jgi:hypothetical protein
MVRKAQCRFVKTKQVHSDRTSIAKYEMNLVDAMYGTCTKNAHMPMGVQHRVDHGGDNV